MLHNRSSLHDRPANALHQLCLTRKCRQHLRRHTNPLSAHSAPTQRPPDYMGTCRVYMHLPQGGQTMEAKAEIVRWKGRLFQTVNDQLLKAKPLKGSILGYTVNGEWQVTLSLSRSSCRCSPRLLWCHHHAARAQQELVCMCISRRVELASRPCAAPSAACRDAPAVAWRAWAV